MRDLQEAANLIVGPPARSLRDVCPHGSGRATQLTRQSIRLLPWKLTSRIVDVQSHLVSFLPYNQFFVVLHSSSSSLTAHCSSLTAHCSKAFHKILPRHLPHFAVQLQLKQRGENFRGGHFVFQLFDDFVDVRGLVGFQQAQDSLFVRREPFVRE